MALGFETQAVSVGGRSVPTQRIQAEMQYHPAADAAKAWQEAAHALVLKALLHDRACALGLAAPADPFDPDGSTDWIDALLDAEIALPPANEDECRRFHAAHPELFEEPMAAEAQHILLAVAPEDADGRDKARELARTLIGEIAADPTRFEPLAGKFSDCPSAPMGGALGRVERGSMVEEFETYLFSLEEGELCPLPVETRFGVHVIRMIRRHPARPSSFETARERVAHELDGRRFQAALRQYLRRLAAATEITGLSLG